MDPSQPQDATTTTTIVTATTATIIKMNPNECIAPTSTRYVTARHRTTQVSYKLILVSRDAFVFFLTPNVASLDMLLTPLTARKIKEWDI